MKSTPIIDVIIPAFNEEKSIAKVIGDIPALVRHVVVANNNSTDRTYLNLEFQALTSQIGDIANFTQWNGAGCVPQRGVTSSA